MLRRSFLLPPASGGGGGGALAATVTFSPLEKYNPVSSGSSNATQYSSATGGTPPYTYAWGRQSGSLDIDGGGGTDSSTIFSAVGSTDPTTTHTAVWRLTVTDAVAAVVTVDFTVTFYFGLEPP